MISTGIAPHLQLARYHAVRKIRHKSDFSAWVWWKFEKIVKNKCNTQDKSKFVTSKEALNVEDSKTVWTFLCSFFGLMIIVHCATRENKCFCVQMGGKSRIACSCVERHAVNCASASKSGEMFIPPASKGDNVHTARFNGQNVYTARNLTARG